MHLDVESILITTEQLQGKVKGWEAHESCEDYKGKISRSQSLKGSLIFFADLLRAIDLPLGDGLCGNFQATATAQKLKRV